MKYIPNKSNGKATKGGQHQENGALEKAQRFSIEKVEQGRTNEVNDSIDSRNTRKQCPWEQQQKGIIS